MSTHTSPFTKRLAQFMGVSDAKAMDAQKAFVAALKEEVEARFPAVTYEDAVGQSLQRMMTPNIRKPLRIAGLGSFKMKTRPARAFESPFTGRIQADTVLRTNKPAAHRLVLTAKWEEIK